MTMNFCRNTNQLRSAKVEKTLLTPQSDDSANRKLSVTLLQVRDGKRDAKSSGATSFNCHGQSEWPSKLKIGQNDLGNLVKKVNPTLLSDCVVSNHVLTINHNLYSVTE